MLSDKITEIVAGAVTIIGAAAVGVLKKYNLIHFGRLESGKETVETVPCKPEKCSDHSKLVEELIKIHDQQLKNGELHRQHIEDLKEGREQFESLKCKIDIIAESVAVLKDRSDREERRQNR